MRMKRRAAALLLTAAAVLVPVGLASARTDSAKRSANAAAACKQWNVAGRWLSIATNNYHVTLNIVQHGHRLSGTASIPPAEAANAGYSTGAFTGTLKGNRFRIVVVWAPRASDGARLHGLYAGTVVSHHIVRGLATDLTTKPTPSPATWVGNGPTRCVKR